MVCDDEFPLREQLTVQLNGCIVKFPDAKPEKVNNRTMVPFRAIAEALGAEVDYNAGAITAKKDGQTLAFSLGGKQLTIPMTAPERSSKPPMLTLRRTRKADVLTFRFAFSRKALALPCSGTTVCRLRFFMTAMH